VANSRSILILLISSASRHFIATKQIIICSHRCPLHSWDPRNPSRLRIWMLIIPDLADKLPDETPLPAARFEMWIEPEVREWWYHTVTKVRLIHAEGLPVELPLKGFPRTYPSTATVLYTFAY